MAAANLTPERLRELLHYNPDTGVFTRRTSYGRWVIGCIAGHEVRKGIHISVDDHVYRAHRLAWLYVYSKWPTHEIDHKDGNQFNNSIDNLRDVPSAVNRENRRRPNSNNKLGILGVMFEKRTGRFRAQLQVRGKDIPLGRYDTAEAAHAAYVEAKRKWHEGCTI